MSDHPHSLSEIHAIMDKVAQHQSKAAPVSSSDLLVEEVLSMYQKQGIEADRSLVEQMVNASPRSQDEASNAVAIVPKPSLFDFGWDRPRTVNQWTSGLNRMTAVYARWRTATNSLSSVAFCAWLGMMFFTLPPWLDHPWIFAGVCMVLAPMLENVVHRQGKRKAKWEITPSARPKQRDRWKASPAAQAYLAAVLESQIPLLKADLIHIRTRVKHDEALNQVRQAQT